MEAIKTFSALLLLTSYVSEVTGYPEKYQSCRVLETGNAIMETTVKSGGSKQVWFTYNGYPVDCGDTLHEVDLAYPNEAKIEAKISNTDNFFMIELEGGYFNMQNWCNGQRLVARRYNNGNIWLPSDYSIDLESLDYDSYGLAHIKIHGLWGTARTNPIWRTNDCELYVQQKTNAPTKSPTNYPSNKPTWSPTMTPTGGRQPPITNSPTTKSPVTNSPTPPVVTNAPTPQPPVTNAPTPQPPVNNAPTPKDEGAQEGNGEVDKSITDNNWVVAIISIGVVLGVLEIVAAVAYKVGLQRRQQAAQPPAPPTQNPAQPA